jgi:hypothetical protein
MVYDVQPLDTIQWIMATDAQGRLLSEDGNYYWDGVNWQLVDAAVGEGLQQSEAGSQDAQGRLLSEDGNYYWDGSNWQLVNDGSVAGPGQADGSVSSSSSDALDGGLTGGVSTPPPAVDWSQAKLNTVKFWINAFISPDKVEGPPGAGLMYDYYYFSGDNRGYSSEIHASSRIHSEVEITGINTGNPQISFQWNVCGESHALDQSGAIVDSKTAEVRGGFQDPQIQGSTVQIYYQGAAAMPLLKVSPDIDLNGWFSVDAFSGLASFNGLVDAFPWYEAYATGNNGAPVTLFTLDPPAGNGPANLVGDANRAASGSATIATQ